MVETYAQPSERLTFSTTIGTGISMSTPSYTPFCWQFIGHYHINKRFSAGIGTGLSFYEKALVPLFIDAKFNITKPQKFTPFLECGVGYSFAPDKNASGGFYFHPSIGMQYSIHNNKSLFVAIGYELQELKRLKEYENTLFTAEFEEKISHNLLSLKCGIIF